jgi:hypothetical protein
MSYVDAEVTAFLVVVDANKTAVTDALGAFVTARPLLFPEYASAVPAAALLHIDDPDYMQSVEPGTVLSTALGNLKANFDSAKTAWEAFLTARNLLTTAPHNGTNVTAMLAALLAANTTTASCTTALDAVRSARPLYHVSYASAVPSDNLLQTIPPAYTQAEGASTALSTALTGLTTGLDTAITSFAAIITARSSVTGP